MTKNELFNKHQEMCHQALELMKKKNHDYSAGEDPFKNFRMCELLGICSTEAGVLVRLSDKLSRIASILSSGKSMVKDESLNDTLIDIINYAIILSGLLEEKHV